MRIEGDTGVWLIISRQLQRYLSMQILEYLVSELAST